MAEELKRWRWQEADLKTQPKGDSVKVALAARLRAETTMTVGWIAERLTMGTRGYLNHLLYRRRKLRASKQYQELTPFQRWSLPEMNVTAPPSAKSIPMRTLPLSK